MTKLMGVVNVTPDSFSDGGLYLDPEAAIGHGRELAAAGAEILDVGGESTRPGAEAVSEDEELRRVIPVIRGLVATQAEISVDTSKAAVASAALDAGAGIVNDVTALRGDAGMASLCAERGATVVLMHMRGEPRTMQDDPRYGDVVAEVKAFLAERVEAAVAAGIAEERIWLDPGIGFGKTAAHNMELLRRLGELRELGRPLVIGTSRKSFIGKVDGSAAGDRLGGTIASSVLAAAERAEVLRVHDVAEMRQALAVATAILGVGSSPMENHGNGIESSAEIELRGLSIYTHHGVSEAEQEVGQRLEFDISFDVPDCDAMLTDRLEDTVDYAQVCDIVALAATERSYKTLERLAQVVGERLMERYGSESVRVRAAKPEPPLPLAIQEVAVEVTQERALEEDEEGED